MNRRFSIETSISECIAVSWQRSAYLSTAAIGYRQLRFPVGDVRKICRHIEGIAFNKKMSAEFFQAKTGGYIVIEYVHFIVHRDPGRFAEIIRAFTNIYIRHIRITDA